MQQAPDDLYVLCWKMLFPAFLIKAAAMWRMLAGMPVPQHFADFAPPPLSSSIRWIVKGLTSDPLPPTVICGIAVVKKPALTRNANKNVVVYAGLGRVNDGCSLRDSERHNASFFTLPRRKATIHIVHVMLFHVSIWCRNKCVFWVLKKHVTAMGGAKSNG